MALVLSTTARDPRPFKHAAPSPHAECADDAPLGYAHGRICARASAEPHHKSIHTSIWRPSLSWARSRRLRAMTSFRRRSFSPGSIFRCCGACCFPLGMLAGGSAPVPTRIATERAQHKHTLPLCVSCTQLFCRTRFLVRYLRLRVVR
jgi:hypothetical protein